MVKAQSLATISALALSHDNATVNPPVIGDLPKGAEMVNEMNAELPATGEIPMDGAALNSETGKNDEGKAPLITAYKPTLEDMPHAIEALIGTAAEFRKSSEVLSSKLDHMTLSTAELLYWEVERSKTPAKPAGVIPDFDVFKYRATLIMTGRIGVKTDKDGKMMEFVIEKSKEQKADEATEKKNNDAAGQMKVVDANFSNIADATFIQYIPTACRAAFLVLLGSELFSYGPKDKDGKKPMECNGTTYQRGYRWMSRGSHKEIFLSYDADKNPVIGQGTKSLPHNTGDAVLCTVQKNPKSKPKLVPFPLDKDVKALSGSYLGIIFNDHVLHPNVELARDTEGNVTYMARSLNGRFANKPYLGTTREGIDRDYERFFGKVISSVRTWPTINPMTGYEDAEKRVTGGTQSETNGTTPTADTPTNENETENQNTDAPPVVLAVDDIGKLENVEARKIWFHNLRSFVENMPSNPNAYTDDEKDCLADILIKLDALMDVINGEDKTEKEDIISRAMGE